MTLADFLDFFLHAERHLEWFIKNYNIWIYALLFAIIFCETGSIVTPFLLDESLLFVVGALAVKHLIQIEIVAAILVDALNYSIEMKVPARSFWPASRRSSAPLRPVRSRRRLDDLLEIRALQHHRRDPLGGAVSRCGVLLRRPRNRAKNMKPVILSIIVVSILPIVWEFAKARLEKSKRA